MCNATEHLEKPPHGGTIVENLVIHGQCMEICSILGFGLDQNVVLVFVVYGIVLEVAYTVAQ